MIETELVGLLVADAAVASLVGDRVALTVLPEGDAGSYVVCQLINGQRAGSMSSTGLNRRLRMQVSCFAKNYLEAKNIANACADAVENYEAFEVVFNGDQDLIDPSTKLFYTVLDYSISQHIS